MAKQRLPEVRIQDAPDSSGSCSLCLLPALYIVWLSHAIKGHSGSNLPFEPAAPQVTRKAFCGHHFICEVTEDPILRAAIATRRPGELGSSLTGTPDDVTGRNSVTNLLSQLEENKFLRFFRQFADEDDQDGQSMVPLDLPDAEVFLKTYEHEHSGFVASSFEQVVHLAPGLFRPDFTELFLDKSLRKAFRNLANRPELIETMDGRRTVRRKYELFGSVENLECEDYIVFTNIEQRDAEREHFSKSARRLCSGMLNIPLPECPNFHLVSPNSIIAASGERQVRRFLIDLLNTPSGYYLVAREGHISVVPTTEHGSFFSSCRGGPRGHDTAILSAVVTSALPTSELLSEFETLLNDACRPKERDIQQYLETHPELLFSLNEQYCELRSHVCLIDSKGERLVPDFMARLDGSQIWEVIELKMPQHALTVRHGVTEKPSAQASRAIAELLSYRDFFGLRTNRDLVTKGFGTAPYEPCLVLVIGRGRARERYEWQSAQAGFPKVQIVSYDYLFERARECKRGISS